MSSKVYAEIAAKIENMLKNGIVPWQKGYSLSRASLAVSHATGKTYSALNQMLLGEAGEHWTFEQARKARLKVKKGSKACQIYFWKLLEIEDKETGEIKDVPFLKSYNVFSSNCIEGAPATVPPPLPENPVSEAEKIAKKYLDKAGIKVKTGPGTPRYNFNEDTITIPARSDYESDAHFFADLFHEIGHSTGAKNRLDRLVAKGKGSASYAREELVAEICAAALCREAGIEVKTDNHASYCAGWMRRLREDPRALVWAAGRADAALKFILAE